MARFLYHSINGGSISVFIKFKSKKLSNSTYSYGCSKQAFCNCCRNGATAKCEIQERRRALNLFLRNVRARDPAEAEERIFAARENIREKQRRLQVLQEEQQALIVQAVTLRDRENH
jgi:hypothetical protein